MANCTGLLCCRAESGFPSKDGDIAAGEWGASTHCDIPVKLYQSMLDFIVDDIKPDMILWTGDNAAHDIWENTSDETIEYTIKTTELLKETVKGHDITILPILGNHDTWVVNIQSFASPKANREINKFKDHWKEWLTPEAFTKFGEYGFYSMPIELKNGKSLPQGSRLIAINTNVCMGINFYLYGQRSDPGGHVAWLE